MKKTLTINLNGIVFHIDEDAYEKLHNYLDAINRQFSNKEEGKEIISDIEARIAELFKEKLKAHRQIVSIEDVNEVIQILGMPEDFSDHDPVDEKKQSNKYERSEKRLYRDPDDRVLGGVCSGLAAYFNIDMVIIRILMIFALFSGFGFMLYIILWIAIPVARTTAQKLEMRGERVNISNIEKTIKDEFGEIKENFRRFRYSDKYNESRDGLSKLVHVIGIVVVTFVKMMAVLFGVILILIGVALLFGISSPIIFGHPFIHSLSVNSFLQLFTDTATINTFHTCLIVLILIPLLFIIWSLLRFLTGIKVNRMTNKIMGFTGFIIWVVFLVISTLR